jgi:MarR family transcriptional regulator, organic hydroperoxide resistance regulator
MSHVDGLGTRLRQLVALLDGAVEKIYREHGLDFRPRFYPYFRLLLERHELSVGQFADELGLTQPAITQTLIVMRKAGLVEQAAARDKRESRYTLTNKSRAMLPELQAIWAAVAAAADALERTMTTPLRSTIDGALSQLALEPFGLLIEKELRR